MSVIRERLYAHPVHHTGACLNLRAFFTVMMGFQLLWRHWNMAWLNPQEFISF